MAGLSTKQTNSFHMSRGRNGSIAAIWQDRVRSFAGATLQQRLPVATHIPMQLNAVGKP